MRKFLVCCSAFALFALASPAAYATGGKHHGNGNGAHQDHTCQGGHNCNTTAPPAAPSPPAAAPAPSTSTSSSTTTTTVNVNVTNTITVQAPAAPAASPCSSSCPATTPAAAPASKRKHACRKVRVTRYKKVWHSGYNRCGDFVRWYTYKKVRRSRRVCV